MRCWRHCCFPGVWEYPIVLFWFALFGQVPSRSSPGALVRDAALSLALLAVVFLGRGPVPTHLARSGQPRSMFLLGLSIASIGSREFLQMPLALQFGIAACPDCYWGGRFQTTNLLKTRSFFGVYRVFKPTPEAIVLMNGTTVHGVRGLLPGEERLPMAYYGHEGPFGYFFAALPAESSAAGGCDWMGAGRTRLLCTAR